MKSVYMQDMLDFSHLQKSCLCKYYIINIIANTDH